MPTDVIERLDEIGEHVRTRHKAEYVTMTMISMTVIAMMTKTWCKIENDDDYDEEGYDDGGDESKNDNDDWWVQKW